VVEEEVERLGVGGGDPPSAGCPRSDSRWTLPGQEFIDNGLPSRSRWARALGLATLLL
jgi:hypothetical protein